MRIAKTITLILALLLGGLAFQGISAEKVEVADALEGTVWARTEDGEPFDEYSFEKGGKYSYTNYYYELSDSGDYRLGGYTVFPDRAVEMIQPVTKVRHVGTIRGDKMTVKMVDNVETPSYVYSKKK